MKKPEKLATYSTQDTGQINVRQHRIYVASFSGLFILISPSMFSNVYFACVLCTICCQFLWIVHFDFHFGVV
jgi:hypothetical protein